MLKRTMILASMAVTAIAVVAPSVASAVWTHHGTPVTGEPAVAFSGSASFVGELGGVSCAETTATGQITPGSSGHVRDFTAVDPHKCVESGGLAFCTLEKVTPTYTHHPAAPPKPTVQTDSWIGDIEPDNTLKITHVSIDNTFSGAFCPYHDIRLTGDVKVTLHNPDTITTGTLSGTLQAFNNTNGNFIQNVTAGGTQTVTPSATYGVT